MGGPAIIDGRPVQGTDNYLIRPFVLQGKVWASCEQLSIVVCCLCELLTVSTSAPGSITRPTGEIFGKGFPFVREIPADPCTAKNHFSPCSEKYWTSYLHILFALVGLSRINPTFEESISEETQNSRCTRDLAVQKEEKCDR